MSFTKRKFATLSSHNRFKKAAQILHQYAAKAPDNYVKEIIQWLNQFEKTNFFIPKDSHSCGILAHQLLQIIEDYSDYSKENLYDKESHIPTKKNSILLHDIRSPYNAGAITRTAAAFGWEKVILSGITPPSSKAQFKKTAMNAKIHIYETNNWLETINQHREKNYTIVGIEKTNKSLPLHKFDFQEPLLVIMGNEEFGIDNEILQYCDGVFHIPQNGSKNSLNVSVAAGIAMYLIGEHDD